MPGVYEGDRPYIFVSYAHADDDAVLPVLEALVAEGYRVWWDKGVELATPFPDYITDHVHDCVCFVPLMSAASLRSSWCNAEVYYALDQDKKILPVYLEDVELPRGIHMPLFYRQHLTRSAFDSDAALYKELFRAKALDPCLMSEGARRRGAKSRSAQQEMAELQAGGQAVGPPIRQVATVHNSVRVSVIPRGSIAEYSWDELKELPQVITTVGDDTEGLAIAKEYHLTDERGRLRGDEKPLMLGDGTKANVRIFGFRHDELADGGRAGISFEFADAPAMHRMNTELTNSGGWERSEMRGWINNSFFSYATGRS